MFTKNTYATDLVVYPVLDETAEYEMDGKRLTGKEIKKDGIKITGIVENNCIVLRLKKV